MIRYILVSGLLLSSITLDHLSAQTADKVVVIRAKLGPNRAGVGTGFFISPGGRVLTAYHVIQNARELTVTSQGVLFPNVVVESISPERDLATLRVGPINGAVPFLKLVNTLPPGGEPLQIIGHPDGNLYVSAPAHMTSSGYRRSGTIKIKGQVAIFSLEDVDLIYLATTLNSGMSGAPVLSSRGAIGVLSGSRDENGTFAWAIPSRYASGPTMHPVNKKVSELGSWPAMTLMNSRWRNLRHSVRLDDNLAEGLNQYFVALEATRAAQEEMIERGERTLATIRLAQRIAQQRAQRGENFNQNDSLALDGFEERATAFVAAGNQWMETRGETFSRLLELELLIQQHYGSVPNTQRNDSLRDTFLRPLRTLEQRLTGTDESQKVIRERLQPAVEAVIAAYTGTSETPAGYALILQKLEGVFTELINEEARLAFAAEGHLLGETGVLVERIMAADYDDAEANWQWSSGLGYQLIIPAGWEQLGEADSLDLTVLANDFQSQGFTLDKVFGRDLSVPGDSKTAVSFLVVGHRSVPLTKKAFDSLAKGAEQRGKEAGLQVERVRNTVLDAIISRGASGAILLCDAVVVGPSQTLWVKLTLPPDRHDLLSQCRSIVESAVIDG